MERYRETSKNGKGQLFGMWAAIAVLLVWLGYEIKTLLDGRISIMGLGYIVFFFAMLLWRYAFRYTYVITDDAVTFVTEGLGIIRSYTVGLSKVESFSDKYHKQFFKRTGISRYLYRYSSADPDQIRILVFNENQKMSGVLFKASDRFIDELRLILPTQFLPLNDKIDETKNEKN